MGAICPQRRISKTRKRQRRSHFKLDNPSMLVCPNCGEIKLAHMVCSSCGYYDGKLVKAPKVKEEEDAKEEKKEQPKEVKKTSKKKETKEVSEEKEVKKTKKSVKEDK